MNVQIILINAAIIVKIQLEATNVVAKKDLQKSKTGKTAGTNYIIKLNISQKSIKFCLKSTNCASQSRLCNVPIIIMAFE